MKKLVFGSMAIVALVFLFSGPAWAQNSESKKRKVFRITGKVTVLLAKSTAKAAVETVKFTGKHIVVPAFKHVAIPIAKATPGIAKNAVKLTAKGIRKGIDAMSERSDEDNDANDLSTASNL